MKKLNLGCGRFKKDGFINLDIDKEVEPDIVWDLNKFPYPFNDNEFDLIEASHVLEHLEKPFQVMKEIYRISKDGAEIIIKVPHFSRGFTHPEHKCGFDVSFFYYFKEDFKGGYSGVKLELKRIRLNWIGQFELKKTIFSKFTLFFLWILNKIINFFAFLSPFLCSRIWCFWVGGFEEIEFNFICKKE